MQEIELWKQYATALQNEIEANNKERNALYLEIDFLKGEQKKIAEAYNQKEEQLKSKQQYVCALEKRLVHSDRIAYEANIQNRKSGHGFNGMAALRESWQSNITHLELRLQEMQLALDSRDAEIAQLTTRNFKLEKQTLETHQIQGTEAGSVACTDNFHLQRKVDGLDNMTKLEEGSHSACRDPEGLKNSQETRVSKPSFSSINWGVPSSGKFGCQIVMNPYKGHPKFLSVSNFSEDSQSCDFYQQQFGIRKDPKSSQFNELIVD